MHRTLKFSLRTLIIAAGLAGVHPSMAQSRHERKNQQLTESAAPQNVQGGATFASPTALDKAFEGIVTKLKREGHAIDRADRDAGEIVTAMEITGGYSQTGTRIQISLIKESDEKTTVRVVVAK